MRTFLTIILFSGLAQAQSITGGPGGYGNSDSLSHAGQDITVRSSTSTAPSGSSAYTTQPGSKVCWDGSAAVACVTYQVIGDVLEAGKALRAPSFTSTATSGTAALTQSTGARHCLDGTTCSKWVSYDGTNIVLSGSLSGTSVTWSGAMSAGSITTTGTANVGSLTSSGTVSGTTFSGTGATWSGSMSAASVTASGAVTGGSLSTTGTASVGSLTSTGAVSGTRATWSDPTKAVTISSNSKVCLNGSACTVSLTHDSTSDVEVHTSKISAPVIESTGNGGVGTYFVINGSAGLLTCNNTVFTRIYRTTDTPAKYCVCLDTGGGGYRWYNLLNPTATGGTPTSCPTTLVP